MAFTNAWDETAPAGTDAIASGDDEIRQFKADIRQRLNTILTSATALANNVDPLIILPRVEVSKNSAAAVGDRRTLNLIEGSNITLTIADDSGGDEIDVTIAAAGGDTASDPTITTVVVDLNSVASTTIISVTEAGRLFTISGLITNVAAAQVSCTLDITIDGGTKRSIVMWTGAIGWEDDEIASFKSTDEAGGGLLYNNFVIPFGGLVYATSLLVAVDCTEASGTAGDDLDVSVLKGVNL